MEIVWKNIDRRFENVRDGNGWKEQIDGRLEKIEGLKTFERLNKFTEDGGKITVWRSRLIESGRRCRDWNDGERDGSGWKTRLMKFWREWRVDVG